jgi:transposase
VTIEPLPPTIMRGAKVRLYPNQAQTATMDLWRRRTISLWNLLLGFEQAAYSGENVRPELRWRQIWTDIVQSNYAKDLHNWNYGWVRSDGSVRKAAGTGKEPIAPAAEQLAAMQPRRDPDAPEPKLFIWERDLMSLMARLKQEPRCAWIGDLPSHAAQAIVKDLIKALQAMLRERKKRANGVGRDTGFPRFKKSRYASGSVYLANTQMFFDAERLHVKLPNGVGQIRCDGLNIDKAAKLMGGRIWREGEDWYLSCQWEVKRPAPLPATPRQAGVKIAASILLTTYDDRGQTREYVMPPPDKRLAQRHKRAGQKLARCMRGQKLREARVATRPKNVRGGKVRLRRSHGFFEASARLAKLEALQRNTRDDYLHKLTSNVVKQFGSIQVQKMEVAKLMKKVRRPKAEEGETTPTNTAMPKRRDLKPVRKLMRHVAMSRCRQLLEYKARDLGRDFGETDSLFPVVQTCSRCGEQHPEMRDGRRIIRCECGAPLPRNRNAAANELKLAKARLGALDV